jgi:putative transposase
MAEVFVKTTKSDYVYVHDRLDAQTVLSKLPKWFEDYNEVHPYKASRPNHPAKLSAVFNNPQPLRSDSGNFSYLRLRER